MKYLGIALLVLIISAMALQAQQSTGMWTAAVNMPMSASATSAGCYAPATGITNWCRTGTGTESVSINGAAYVQVYPPPPATTGVQKVQGAFPGATGNVSLTCTVPFPAAMATFTAGTSTSAQFAASNILANCVGQGN